MICDAEDNLRLIFMAVYGISTETDTEKNPNKAKEAPSLSLSIDIPQPSLDNEVFVSLERKEG